MADEILKRDQNTVTVLGGVTDDSNQYVTMLRVDPTTKRLLVSATGVASGTVTSISQGTGILLSTNPITTTGSVSLATSLQPMATLTGNSLKVLRVNAGETAVEYATVSSGLTVGTTTITSGTTTRILYDNAGVLGEYSVIPVSLGGTNATSASITAFNNITGYTASGATGTTSTNLVFSTSPVLTTPTLGVASATSINKVAITAPATSATLTIADGKTATHNATTTFAGTDGKTLTISNSLTLAGTDSTVMTFPTTSATIARTDAANTFTGVQTFNTPIAASSVATMTSTVGGGVPTPPNNTTTFLRGDGTFAAPAGGSGFNRVGGDSAEYTTSSTTKADLVTISGLSIAAGTRFKITGKFRKTSGAGAGGNLFLFINSTLITMSSNNGFVGTDATDEAQDGIFEIEGEVGETNYLASLWFRSVGYASSTGAWRYSADSTAATQNLGVLVPSATITSFKIQGSVGSGSISIAVKNLQVYTYANS